MNLEPLLRTTSPHLHAMFAEAGTAYDALRAVETRGATVRFIRGRKAKSIRALFDEMAAALQFPPYFGENWDAVSDCLMDATWIEAKATGGVIVFLGAPELLESATPADAQTLLDILTRSVKAQPTLHTAYPSRSIHVVFQARPEDSVIMNRRWPSLNPLE